MRIEEWWLGVGRCGCVSYWWVSGEMGMYIFVIE